MTLPSQPSCAVCSQTHRCRPCVYWNHFHKHIYSQQLEQSVENLNIALFLKRMWAEQVYFYMHAQDWVTQTHSGRSTFKAMFCWKENDSGIPTAHTFLVFVIHSRQVFTAETSWCYFVIHASYRGILWCMCYCESVKPRSMFSKKKMPSKEQPVKVA